ncbi:hypothetical protein E1A91_D12G244900v1 [Gossypium mustelinum]|uniref:ATP-dependent Clp protease proteolytic subunit n=2 Tax=Gossypium TaxID=3633 RepID=A0A5D2SKI3_GOSMU|nr:hypothetical protein ES332_D12G254800v1 [Gossypium tomentosum]TYH40553.1 hypothetical protein ES332_D12G254800v1 [Gossypium tomentosum]TYI52394.1 hypothetical protein E1A91_D12G244900v1 [Gossypium mustelinum]TYI52395.1 hypothetical protein E1A91_D12G244900v1 [Gossypium mustelinum]
MEVATAAASSFALHARMLSPPTSARIANPTRTLTSPPSTSLRASLSTNFLSPFPTVGSVSGDFSGLKLRIDSLYPASLCRSKPKRGVVTMVIPFSRGSAWEQPPPDLASYLYKNRIVYLGMSLVPSVTELILAEFLYLQYEDEQKPIYLYINSTGTTKVKLYAKHMGKSTEQIEEDIRRPKYFSPSEAVEYGIIDKVLYNERSSEDSGVVSDLKKAQLI